MGRKSGLWQGNCPDRLKVAGRAAGNLRRLLLGAWGWSAVPFLTHLV